MAEGLPPEYVAVRLRKAVGRPLEAWREVYESFSPVDVRTGERRPRIPPAGGGSLLETALREAEEEIDLSPDLVEVVGELEEMYIPPSNFRVSPFVGLLSPAAEMVLAPDEVEAIFTVSLDELMSPETLRRVPWRRDGRDYQEPIFAVGGSPSRNIWGATAAMTASLLVRLGWRGYRSLAGE